MTIQKSIILLLIGLSIGFTCSKKTVDYEIKTVSFEQPIEGTDMNLTLKCVYPVFKETSPFWHQVNEAIIDKMKASIFDESTHATFDDLWNTFPDFFQAWALDRNAAIVFQNSKVLSIQFSTYQNTGGAHPNSFTYYLNYDLKKKKELTLADLFLPDSLQAFTRLAETEFRNQYEIPEGESLNSHGYFFENDQFQLSRTFTIKETGILLYYNRYEIAPYVAGPIELFLPFDQLKSIINPIMSFAFLTVKKG